MNRKISVILLVFIMFFTVSGCDKNSNTKVGTKEITDITGNVVKIPNDVNKVLIQGSGSGGAFMTMMALDRDNFTKKIVAMDDGINTDRNDLWIRLVEKKPELQDIKKIGDISKNEVSAEEILNINPDVIIVPVSYKPSLDEINKKINIPVVYIDYHDQDLDKHLKSTEIIASSTGLNKNLDEINSFYKEKVGNIIKRASEIEEKPTVYAEIGYSGPSEYDLTYGKNKMWGRIIEDTAGKNIMSDVLNSDDAKAVAPEYILKSDPDKIIITGAIWTERPDSMKLGFDIKKEDVENKIQEYTKRDGWNNLKAVKNKEVYAIGHSMCRDMTDFYSYEVLAKLFHKEEFKDIDPEKDIREYYEKFMPIEFEGTWFVKYE